MIQGSTWIHKIVLAVSLGGLCTLTWDQALLMHHTVQRGPSSLVFGSWLTLTAGEVHWRNSYIVINRLIYTVHPTGSHTIALA